MGRRTVLVYIFLVLFVGSYSLPFFYLYLLSFSPVENLFKGLSAVTSPTFSLENYYSVRIHKIFPRALLNSSAIALTVTGISIILSTFGGYALARFSFRGKTAYHGMLLISQLTPTLALLIPLFILLSTLGLLNTYLALIITHLSFTVAFGTWIMSSYISSIRRDIEEAALLDGCSRAGVVRRVLIPVILPGIFVVGTFSFIESWGDFIFALTLTRTDDMMLLSTLIYSILGVGSETSGMFSRELIGSLVSMSAIFALPTLILAIFFQRYIVRGLTAGAGVG